MGAPQAITVVGIHRRSLGSNHEAESTTCIGNPRRPDTRRPHHRLRDDVAWQSQLVSVNSAGTSGGNQRSIAAVFSPDGTKIAFESTATDLVPGAASGAVNIYVRDLTKGTTSLVSANTSGAGGNNNSEGAVFSSDSSKVAFFSFASDLVPVDTNGQMDVFVRDLTTGTTTLASANAAGTDSANGGSRDPVFSPDGTGVAFSSNASNFGPLDPGGLFDVDLYLRDLTTGTTTLVSTNPEGTDGGNGQLSFTIPVFSPDGSVVYFDSNASNLGPTDTNDTWDIYRRDRDTGITTLVTTNAAGTEAANGPSGSAQLTADGTRIFFESGASDLGVADSNGIDDVYMLDLTTGGISLVSTNAAGTGAGNGESGSIILSPSSDKIAFWSYANDLVPGGSTGNGELFVRDLGTGTTTLVLGAYSTASFSPDGGRIVFPSEANDLGPTDTNQFQDVYVQNLASGTVELVSAKSDGSDSANEDSYGPAFSPTGNRILFHSYASNLGPTDANDRMDVYVATLR